MHDTVNAFVVKLQGRFTGDDAENIRSLVTRSRITLTLLVDLTDVTFVDAVGESALQFFGRMGAEFVASNSYALDICDRLHLPLVTNRRMRAFTGNLKKQDYVEATAETGD